MTIKDDLIAARDLISDPKHWCQGAFAYNQNGEQTHSMGNEAVCWCALGAIKNVTQAIKSPARDFFRRSLGVPITTFNDHSPHATVIAAFDKAIEEAP